MKLVTNWHLLIGFGKVETVKIQCGKAHFKALGGGDYPARAEPVINLSDLLAGIEKS